MIVSLMESTCEKSIELLGKDGKGGRVRKMLHDHDIHCVGKEIDEVYDDVGRVLNLWDDAFLCGS